MWHTIYFSGTRDNHTDSTSKNEENTIANFDLEQMMPKDNTAVEVDTEELRKAKVGSGEIKNIDAAGVSKDGKPMQPSSEVELEKVEDQSRKVNAGTKKLGARTGKTEVESVSL